MRKERCKNPSEGCSCEKWAREHTKDQRQQGNSETWRETEGTDNPEERPGTKVASSQQVAYRTLAYIFQPQVSSSRPLPWQQVRRRGQPVARRIEDGHIQQLETIKINGRRAAEVSALKKSKFSSPSSSAARRYCGHTNHAGGAAGGPSSGPRSCQGVW